MQTFVNRNKKALQSPECKIYIPAFEWQQISDASKSLANYLKANKFLVVYSDSSVKQYSDLIAVLGKTCKEKGQLCFVVGADAKRQAILEAAKQAGVFVQIFQLSPEGNIITFPHKESRKHEPRKENSGPARFDIVKVPERMPITLFRPKRQATSGTVVIDRQNKRYRLGSQMATHPNGTSYATDDPKIWIKIFEGGALNSYTFAKIERMLSRPVQYDGLCWPIDIVHDEENVPVGIVLPASSGHPLHLSLFKQAKLESFFPNWNKRDLCDVTLTILKTIQYLHSRNILLGCINPAAIRVVSKNEVYFLDTENYQIEGFPTLVYNNSFTPPELFGRKIYLCDKSNENYAVAMLVFMLMMPGKTPYVIDAKKTIDDAMKERKFPFPCGNIHGSHAMPGLWRFMWSHLTPLKELFFNTFQKGAQYDSPEKRRGVGALINAVEQLRKELENPVDNESLKIYPATFKRGKGETFYTCRYCGVAHPRFYFNNDYFESHRICNSCIGKKSRVSFTCKACHKTYYYTNATALFHETRRNADSGWKDQKYCHDCKAKTVKCSDCGNEVPYYKMEGPRCFDCHEKRRNSVYKTIICKDCGRSFTITVGEHEFMLMKGHDEPVRCKGCREKRKNSSW